ncbi:MAG: ribosome biogenesis GTPase YlqF, partial [Clostridia bacterium]|nr:ribosome biogenesis GTPase YlqF [Clostridia bacterium]
MAKTRRKIAEQLKLIDAVAEIVDARIPVSSRNPDLKEIIGDKPHLILLNKCDMADETATKDWIKFYKSQGIYAIPIDCKNGKGISAFKDTVKTVLADRLVAYREKGMVGKPLRVLVVGIPNVGKSSF